MLTMLYMLLDGVMGMEISMLGYAACTLAYFIFSFLFKVNRAGKWNVVLGWLACELLCDAVWYLIFYHNGDYVNYGIGGAAALLLLPAALFMAAILITCLNEKEKR